MHIYFDFEMTGLHHETDPISLGMKAENGKKLYLEFTDYDPLKVDDWVQEHVIEHMWTQNEIPLQYQEEIKNGTLRYKIVTHEEAPEIIKEWLNAMDNREEHGFIMYGDCLAYDWMLFCRLFGTAFDIPDNIYYIPMDLCTTLFYARLNPDVSREGLAGVEGQKHNALFDAEVIELCKKEVDKVRMSSYHL